MPPPRAPPPRAGLRPRGSPPPPGTGRGAIAGSFLGLVHVFLSRAPLPEPTLHGVLGLTALGAGVVVGVGVRKDLGLPLALAGCFLAFLVVNALVVERGQTMAVVTAAGLLTLASAPGVVAGFAVRRVAGPARAAVRLP